LRKIFSTTTTVLLVCLYILVIPGQTIAAPVTLSYSGDHDARGPHHHIIQEWIKEVEKRTNGKVKFDYFFSGTKVSGPQTYNAVVGDYVDIGYTDLAYTRGLFPMMEVVNLPLGFMDAKINTAIINEVYDKFKPAEFDKIKMLYIMAPGQHYLHMKDTPVRTIEDLKGKRIHYNGLSDQLLEKLEAIPVSLPMPAISDALYQDRIDGGLWDFSASNRGGVEGTKYDIICDTTAHTAMLYIMMNRDKWDALDDDVKRVFNEIDPMWAAKHADFMNKAAISGQAYAKKNGSTTIEITPEEAARWAEAAEPIINNYITNMKSRNLPGKEVVEFIQKRLQDAKNGTFKSPYMN
jgi:TRAP-type C4-dicarboxylate transport system substrate-binding protein